jgi:hypothetical protein
MHAPALHGCHFPAPVGRYRWRSVPVRDGWRSQDQLFGPLSSLRFRCDHALPLGKGLGANGDTARCVDIPSGPVARHWTSMELVAEMIKRRASNPSFRQIAISHCALGMTLRA